MRANWLALGAFLCSFALAGSGTDVVARTICSGLLLAALLRDHRRFLVLAAILLGLTGAWRVSTPPTGPFTPDHLVVAAVEVIPTHGTTARAWVRCAGSGAEPARLVGAPSWARSGGTRLVVRGRRLDPVRASAPDDRDPWRSLRARGVHGTFLVRDVLEVRRLAGPGRIDRFRGRIAAGLDRRLGNGSGLWRALVLADSRALERRARGRVQHLGFAHLLALSGLHTSVVLAAVLLPFRKRGRRMAVFALPLLAGWLVVAGLGPSLTRAVLMVGWWVLAHRLGRRADVRDAVAAAALVEAAWRPTLLCGVGWWMSYVATLAVVQTARATRGWPAWAKAPAISVGATAATAPWVLDTFGLLNAFAPVTLLAAGPVFALVFTTGLAGLAIGSVMPALQGAADAAVLFASHGFGILLRLMEPATVGLVRAPGAGERVWCLELAVVAAVLWPSRAGWRARASAAAALLLALCILPRPDHEWVVFDVGQGDAMVLRCQDRALVVDTGPRYENSAPVAWTVEGWLERRPRLAVELLVTHGHRDHDGGVAELIASGCLDRIHVAATDADAPWVRALRSAAPRVPVQMREAGQEIDLGHCRLEVLGPARKSPATGANDRSLVLRWATPGGAILLTGDAESLEEGRILDRVQSWPRVSWLKVAHHGGNTGTGTRWLQRTRPAHAVISTGAGNRYGHPHPDLLERLATAGVHVHRTDRDGYLRLSWRDGDAEVRVERGRRR